MDEQLAAIPSGSGKREIHLKAIHLPNNLVDADWFCRLRIDGESDESEVDVAGDRIRDGVTCGQHEVRGKARTSGWCVVFVYRFVLNIHVGFVVLYAYSFPL